MMKQNNFSDFFKQNDFAKLFEGFKAVPFDMKSLMETQRKNLQALSEAQQITVESLQTIAQRQSQILSQIVEDNSLIAKELMAEGTPEEKIAKNADLFKSLYERSVKNMNELNDMLNATGQEAAKVISKRVSASMTEIKSSLDKSATNSKKAA